MYVWLLWCGAVISFAYVALVAWYTLGIEGWRAHTLYAPLTWEQPTGGSMVLDYRRAPRELWRFYK